MTREETVKVLAILKAAYPNSYARMTPAEGKGVVTVWQSQLSDFPGEVVLIAIDKLIATNQFPPTIAEVKKKIGDIHTECVALKALRKDRMSDVELQKIEMIRKACEKVRNNTEPSLGHYIFGEGAGLLEAHDS